MVQGQVPWLTDILTSYFRTFAIATLVLTEYMQFGNKSLQDRCVCVGVGGTPDLQKPIPLKALDASAFYSLLI